MKKGDNIYLDDIGNELKITPGLVNNIPPHKEITITVDSKDEEMIKRELRDAYIHNFNQINLVGENIPKHSQLIHSTAQNLMALEIMEQTAKRITAKDLINVDRISIEGMIRKIDFNIRGMITDAIKLETKEEYLHLIERDDAINRMCYLLFRHIRYAFENPAIIRKTNTSEIELLDLFRIVEFLEKIGDETKRFAKRLFKSKLPKTDKESLAKLYSRIEQYYLETMKVHFTKNGAEAFKLAHVKDVLIEECESIFDEQTTSKNHALLVESAKDFVQSIHNLERIAYKYNYVDSVK